MPARRSSKLSGAAKNLSRTVVHEKMHAYKVGALHSGRKTGPIVKARKQAIAISLSVADRTVKKAGGSTRKMAALAGASTKRRKQRGKSNAR